MYNNIYDYEPLIRLAFKGTQPPRDFKSRLVTGDLPAGMQPRQPWKPAAVLVPVVMHPGNMTVLMTRRNELLLDHGGQVSFPGGSCEARDTDPVQTALRETEEETGLERRYVETVGFLDGYLTITSYAVTPVVGLVKPDFNIHTDPLEVAEVFEVPLSFLRDPANRQVRTRRAGERDVVYNLFEYKKHVIWGATAGMLINFIEKLEQVEAA